MSISAVLGYPLLQVMAIAQALGLCWRLTPRFRALSALLRLLDQIKCAVIPKPLPMREAQPLAVMLSLATCNRAKARRLAFVSIAGTVYANVLLAVDQCQILWCVVRLNAIAMMHDLTRPKRTTQHLRHYKPVFGQPATDPSIRVIRGIDHQVTPSAHVTMLAGHLAHVVAAYESQWLASYLAALGASLSSQRHRLPASAFTQFHRLSLNLQVYPVKGVAYVQG